MDDNTFATFLETFLTEESIPDLRVNRFNRVQLQTIISLLENDINETNNPVSYIKRGNLHMSKFNYGKALECYEEAAKQDYIKAYIILGNFYGRALSFETENLFKSLYWYNKVIDHDNQPDNIDINFCRLCITNLYLKHSGLEEKYQNYLARNPILK